MTSTQYLYSRLIAFFTYSLFLTTTALADPPSQYTFDHAIVGESVNASIEADQEGDKVSLVVSIPPGSGDILGLFFNLKNENLLNNLRVTDRSGHLSEVKVDRNRVEKLSKDIHALPLTNWDVGIKFKEHGKKKHDLTKVFFSISASGLSLADIFESSNNGYALALRINVSDKKKNFSTIALASQIPPVVTPGGEFRYVNSDGVCRGKVPCYNSIQKAVGAVKPGETIRIQAGRYNEKVEINEKNYHKNANESDRILIERDPYDLIGSVVLSPPSVTKSSKIDCRNAFAIEVSKSKYLTISGLTITDSQGAAISLDGQVHDNSSIHVERNRIFNNGSEKCDGGIVVKLGNKETVIANNLIYSNIGNGITFFAETGGPDYVVGNTIYGNSWNGVRLSVAQRIFFVNNIIHGNGTEPSRVGHGRFGNGFGIKHHWFNFKHHKRVKLFNNLICANPDGDAEQGIFDDDDRGNATCHGKEGPRLKKLPDCPTNVFVNVAGADGVIGTDDDDFTLKSDSPALNSGKDPAELEFPQYLNLLWKADYLLPSVRPQGAGFDIGAIEQSSVVVPPPSISISSPVDGAIVNQTSFLVSGSVSRADLVTVNGVAATIENELFSAELTLSEGAQVITAIATNSAGSEQSVVSIIVDTTLPEITLLTPQDGAFTTEAEILVTGSVSEATELLSFKINNQLVALSNGTFSQPIPLVLGQNVIAIEAIDRAQNTTLREVTVRRGTPPVVTILSPDNNLLTNAENVEILGEVSGSAPITLRINDNEVTVVDEHFSYQANLVAGLNTIEVVATNAFGSASLQRIVERDSVLPELTIDSPADGLRTLSPAVLVSGSVVDTHLGSEILINGEPYPLTTSSYSVTVPLSLGANTITTAVDDLAGNSATKSITVYRGELPVITILSPVNGANISESVVAVTGTAPSATAVSVNGVAAAISDVNFSASVALSEGTNSIEAIATNLYGTAQTAITVNLDTVSPVITSTAPTSVNEGETYSYQVIASDLLGLRFLLTTSPGGMGIDETTGLISWAPTTANIGDHQIVVRVTDSVGNFAEQSFQLSVIDVNVAPNIVSSPVATIAEGESYSYSVVAEDQNNEPLNFSLSKAPAGMIIDSATGEITWNPEAGFTLASATANPFCQILPLSTGQLDPQVKWHWTAPSGGSINDFIYSAPAVAQLSDDNGDGEIDQNDIPDAVFVSSHITPSQVVTTSLNIVSGDDGSEIVTRSDLLLGHGTVALGDIDHDGIVEIITVSNDLSQLLAFEHDATLKWSKPTGFSADGAVLDAIALADLDGDGNAEIILRNKAFSSTGDLLWTGAGDAGGGSIGSTAGDHSFSAPIPADINLDGNVEIVAGRTLYRNDGTIIWHRSDIVSTYGDRGKNAIGNFDSDAQGEIVLAIAASGGSSGRLYLLDNDGSTIWQSAIPADRNGSYLVVPTVADVDNDGLPEIIVTTKGRLTVFESDGTIKWWQAVADTSNLQAGSSVFDFDQDGSSEIVYSDSESLIVFDGKSGSRRLEIPNQTGTAYEYPIAVDIDNDGQAEIIAISTSGSTRGMRAIESASNSWAATRAIWNQHAYSIDNVTDSGAIPATPLRSWLTHNSFHLNQLTDQDPKAQIDLAITRIGLVATGADAYKLSIAIKNVGLAPSERVSVVTFHNGIDSSGTTIGAIEVTNLAAGEEKNYDLSDVDTDQLVGAIYAEIKTPTTECNLLNNSALLAVVEAVVSDQRGLEDTQLFSVHVTNTNQSPQFISEPIKTATETQTYSYQPIVQDFDRGDKLVFSLVQSPAGMTIEKFSGAISWTPTARQAGVYPIAVRVVDLAGLIAEQSFELVVADKNQPPFITQGLDGEAISQVAYTSQILASDIDGDGILFSLIGAPSGMTVDAVTGFVSWYPNVSQVGTTAVTVRATDSQGNSIDQSSEVLVFNFSTRPTITSTPLPTGSVGAPSSKTITATDPDLNDKITFSLPVAPLGMTINPTTGLLYWFANLDQVGDHPVTIRAQDRAGNFDEQSFTVTIINAQRRPFIISIPPTTAYIAKLYNYQVAAEISPDTTLTNHYFLVTAPTGMTINELSGLIAYTPTATAYGSRNVTVRARRYRGATAVGLTSDQSYTLVVTEENLAPQLSSIPTQTAEVGVVYNYQMVASDPNLSSQTNTLTYVLLNGPAGMQINPTTGLVSWTPNSSQIGVSQVAVQVQDNAGGFAKQYFGIAVSDPAATANTAPQFTSTPPFVGRINYQYSYQLQAADAENDSLRYSIVSAPSGVLVDSQSGLLTWVPTVGGDYTAVVQVADQRGGFGVQSWSLKIRDESNPLAASLHVAPKRVVAGEEVTITAALTGIVGNVDLSLTVDGTTVALNQDQQATLVAPESSGDHPIELIVTDRYETVTVSDSFYVLDPNDTTPPTVEISAPAENSEVTMFADVVGTIEDANLARWNLTLVQEGSGVEQPLAQGVTSVTNGVLGKIDATLLLNGIYQIKLYAEDLNGQSNTAILPIRIDGQAKVGIFTMTFTDLEVPVSGIPITVLRTYDTRKKSFDNFGVGWTLEVKRGALMHNRPTGNGWTIGSSGGGLPLPCQNAVELQSHVTEVRISDGEFYLFRPTLNGLAPVIGGCTGNIAFEQIDGSTPGASLEILQGESFIYQNGFGVLTDPDTLAPFVVADVKLTTADGRSYDVKLGEGVTKLEDRNGNKLTFTKEGIFHSDGKSLLFTRDTLDRITKLTAPDQTEVVYDYDELGNLIQVTNQVGEATSFLYDDNHYLTDVIDPRGITPARLFYDESGRLIKSIDAEGNEALFEHDLENRIETTRNRRGFVTAHDYDERGNVLSRIDARGGSTSYSYDSEDNQLTETDENGHTTTRTYNATNDMLSETDPLGRTTQYDYDLFRNPTKIVDPLGNETLLSYDAKGNLETITDAKGKTTTNQYDLKGRLVRTIDAQNNATITTYNTFGYPISQTDALGAKRTMTYDQNGNKLSDKFSRTTASGIVEQRFSYAYDLLNRVVEETNGNGERTFKSYNRIGKVETEFDPRGKVTRYFYDTRGSIERTILPDGTVSRHEYDAEGNKIKDIDGKGATTTYTYDQLNRLVKTTLPEGDTTEVIYDPAGRVVVETDGRGNTKTNHFDDAGQVVRVVNALNEEVLYGYDDAGNQTSITDHLGRITLREFDELNREVKTIYPDGSYAEKVYDELSRVVAAVDQAGIATTYQYDANSRLAKVIDALGGETSYSYDEVGNKLTQADAEGRITSWSYDNVGRVLSRTLPLGQSEIFSYDVSGNTHSHTDLNGNTTSYTYDDLNRLVQKTYADNSQEQISYTETGQVATETNYRGTVTYTYDDNDRLVRQENPNGSFIAYSYDLAGNRTAVETAGGVTSYSFDELNRLELVIDPDAGVSNYDYDTVGNLFSVTQANGTVTEHTYDELNRLTLLSTKDSNNNLITSFDYTLDAVGNRLSVVEASGRTVNYVYDDLHRLIAEQVLDFTNGDALYEYSYDAVGNRLTKHTNGTLEENYSYDANDQLLHSTTSSFSYDNNGNTLVENTATGSRSYSYDFDNRLIQAITPNEVVNYSYDTSGIRQSKSVNGLQTTYTVDKNRDYAQVLEERDSASGDLLIEYVHGVDLLSQQISGMGSYYFHTDGLGSTRALTDNTQLLTDSYDYEAFGQELTSSFGSTPNSYRYTGEQYDGEVAKYYLRDRYYSPTIGRFGQMDRWMGHLHRPLTLNKYLYGYSNPVVNIDPSGQAATSIAELQTTTALQQAFAQNLLNTIGVVAVVLHDNKGKRRFDHRGRIQAQGKDTIGAPNHQVNKKGMLEISVPWALPVPLPLEAGLRALESLKFLLAERQLNTRIESGAFSEAERFMRNAAPNGVEAPVSESFPKLKKTDRDRPRVDIEVRKGRAFVNGG